MVRVNANYHWDKITSGVFVFVVFKHLSKTMFIVFIVNNGLIFQDINLNIT